MGSPQAGLLLGGSEGGAPLGLRVALQPGSCTSGCSCRRSTAGPGSRVSWARPGSRAGRGVDRRTVPREGAGHSPSFGGRSWAEGSFWPPACVPTRSQPGCGPPFPGAAPSPACRQVRVMLLFLKGSLWSWFSSLFSACLIQTDEQALCWVIVVHH